MSSESVKMCPEMKRHYGYCQKPVNHDGEHIFPDSDNARLEAELAAVRETLKVMEEMYDQEYGLEHGKITVRIDREKAAIAAALRQAASICQKYEDDVRELGDKLGHGPEGWSFSHVSVAQTLRLQILALISSDHLGGASTWTEKSQGEPGSLREGDNRT